jgi:hypothetical protein
MKKNLLKFIVIPLACLTATSCMTTYDAYGRPVQSVDPGAAAAGVAAAGIIGYAAGRDRGRDRYYRPAYRHRTYAPYYRSGYYAPRGYYWR